MRRRDRAEFPASVKATALKRCLRNEDPHCERCKLRLNARTGLFFDHERPDGLGGTSTIDNCQVLCRTCHDLKTVSEDVPRMAKADAVFKAHHGVKRRKGPAMPGSKASGFKRKINGGVVRR